MPEGITPFGFPPRRRLRLRTNNGLARLSKEIKRRIRVATLFSNEASLLRLVSAVLSEISNDWETYGLTRTWKPDDPPLKTAIDRRDVAVSLRMGWKDQHVCRCGLACRSDEHTLGSRFAIDQEIEANFLGLTGLDFMYQAI